MEREVSGSSQEDSKRLDDRGSIAMGIAVICLLFLIETVVAHQTTPNALSPLVWSVLGGVGAVSMVLAAVWRTRAKRLGT